MGLARAEVAAEAGEPGQGRQGGDGSRAVVFGQTVVGEAFQEDQPVLVVRADHVTDDQAAAGPELLALAVQVGADRLVALPRSSTIRAGWSCR